MSVHKSISYVVSFGEFISGVSGSLGFILYLNCKYTVVSILMDTYILKTDEGAIIVVRQAIPVGSLWYDSQLAAND